MLHKLSDTELTVADPAEDVRGRTVVDRNGDEVGEVDDLLLDDRENKVRFLRVGAGGRRQSGRAPPLPPQPMAAYRVDFEGETNCERTRDE